MARRRTVPEEAPIQFAMLPLEQLQFDATNPRIVERLGRRPGQQQIYNLLVTEEDAKDLIPSFVENGYLPTDPLIVRPEQNGKYSVLEGNRRLAALQSMQSSEDEGEITAFEEKNLKELPCLIFRGGEGDELAYLGLRHISKTKDWSPAAKSAFVERLLRSGVSLVQAGRRTNTSPQALRQLLLTRRLFEQAVQLGIETPSIAAERDLVFWPQQREHGGLAMESELKWPNALRILVVEDNRDVAVSQTMLLQLLGFEVHVAHNGAAALAAAAAILPDVVLLDIGLPDINGWQLATSLQNIPLAKKFFIIALTGFGQERDRHRSSEVGIDLHLVKPVDPEELLAVLQRFQKVVCQQVQACST